MAQSYIQSCDWDAQHDGTEHLAIHNTRFRRALTRIALKTTGKLYTRKGLCVPISKHKIVKAGHRVHLTEGATMQYLAENTSIPVPKVYCSFIHKKRAYIVMERIQGEPLSTVLTRKAADSLKDEFAQLKKIFEELHALAPPAQRVESCAGGSLYDSRLPHGNPRFGPFETIQEFHSWLRRGLKTEELRPREGIKDWHDTEAMIKRQDGPWPAPVFCHGDLNPSNIMIRDGKVAGIIDWEFAGWYPHYWEYTSAWFGNCSRTWWQDMLNQFLDRPCAEDMQMEEVRNKWWGEF